jgi:hypothetical protein
MASTSLAAATVGRQTGAASRTGSLRWRDHACNEMAGRQAHRRWHHGPPGLSSRNQAIHNNVNTISTSLPAAQLVMLPSLQGHCHFEYEHQRQP